MTEPRVTTRRSSMLTVERCLACLPALALIPAVWACLAGGH